MIYLLLCVLNLPGNFAKPYKISIAGTAQGTTYHLTYFSTDSIVKKKQVDSIFNRIDSSLSLYKTYSLVSRFNNDSRGIKADIHLKRIIEKANDVTKNTRGIFDITIYPATEAWGFGLKESIQFPRRKEIQRLKKCIGNSLLRWSGDSLLKSRSCVRLDPNGIAQGYTADVIADFLERNNIHDYIVEIGGEMRIKGIKEDNQPIRIAIETPGEDPWDVSMSHTIIAPGSGAITTSGSYRKFYESKGKKVSHIIDARTAKPSDNELISVTVYAKDAITADAYDNSLMVMGLKEGLRFCESHPEIAAYFIYKKSDGSVAAKASKRFPSLLSTND